MANACVFIGQGARGSHNEEEVTVDVFDAPEAEPTELFVNPFACNIDPMEWRLLQVDD